MARREWNWIELLIMYFISCFLTRKKRQWIGAKRRALSRYAISRSAIEANFFKFHTISFQIITQDTNLYFHHNRTQKQHHNNSQMLHPTQNQTVELNHPFDHQAHHFLDPAHRWTVCHLDYIL